MPSYVDGDGAVRDSIIATLSDADQLRARRQAIVKKVSHGRALFGQGGHFGERVFKAEEAKVATAVRAKFKLSGMRATEGMVDEAIRQQPDYLVALMDVISKKQAWIELEEELNDIEWQLKIRTSDSYLLGAELKLT